LPFFYGWLLVGTETAEPEEALEFLRQYHRAVGPLISQFEGTAIGTFCNLAAEAKDGQILVSSRIAEAVETVAALESETCA
jgi:class 3 adenylate cyclase